MAQVSEKFSTYVTLGRRFSPKMLDRFFPKNERLPTVNLEKDSLTCCQWFDSVILKSKIGHSDVTNYSNGCRGWPAKMPYLYNLDCRLDWPVVREKFGSSDTEGARS